MIYGIFIPFFSILLAELFDKSQLTILLLSTKTKNHFQLFLGTVIAFAVVDGLAILIGSWLTGLIPEQTLRIVSGIAFVIFGILTLRNTDEKERTERIKHGALTAGFLAVFVSEWGDKTQLASAVFATQFQPILVFIGVLSALTLLSLMAVYLGKALAKRIDRVMIGRVSGIAFILLGLYFLLS